MCSKPERQAINKRKSTLITKYATAVDNGWQGQTKPEKDVQGLIKAQKGQQGQTMVNKERQKLHKANKGRKMWTNMDKDGNSLLKLLTSDNCGQRADKVGLELLNSEKGGQWQKITD